MTRQDKEFSKKVADIVLEALHRDSKKAPTDEYTQSEQYIAAVQMSRNATRISRFYQLDGIDGRDKTPEDMTPSIRDRSLDLIIQAVRQVIMIDKEFEEIGERLKSDGSGKSDQ